MKTTRTVAMIASGLGLLYFAWLYSAMGIFTGSRGRVAITREEDPERFWYSVGIVAVLAAVALVLGVVRALRGR